MGAIETRLTEYLDNHSSVIKITINADGTIREANRFAEQLAGRALKAEHITAFFTDFNANLDVKELINEEIQKTRLNVNTNLNMPETFYFTSFRTDEGVVLIGETDSDETKNMRQVMLSLNNELSNLTRELQKKNAQLDQLNKLKNQFLGMAAHDLRNPISSIMMFSEFVLDTNDYEISDDLRKIIELIKESSGFMLRMLEELLDVVKIESGSLQLNLEVTNVESLLKKNIDVNTLFAAKKDIKLALNVPEPLPEVEVDSVKIEQVLNNLISNAIKFSHSDTTITVSAFSTGEQILITVEDQGQGIPEKELEKVFIPFSKVSVKGTSGENSTGLGLSIVKRIVTGHQGRIWVESIVGKGSLFHFTLPLKLK